MRNNIIFRLAVYYASWLVCLAGAFHFLPRMRYYVIRERERILLRTLSDAGADLSALLENIQEGLGSLVDQGRLASPEGLPNPVFELIDPSRTVPVVVALILAFGVTLPITWVYRWTRPGKKYNQSFAHTLLVIPIAIALIVFLVKGSLALAFSLAGIVAAVRFRTALSQPMDAVYMLMAIGIGLATGTQHTSVAYLASLIFVIIALGAWRSNFGAEPVVLSGWRIVQPEEQKQVAAAAEARSGGK